MKTIAVLGEQHQEVLGRLAALEAQLAAGHDMALAGFAAYLEHEVMHHFALEEDALFGGAQEPVTIESRTAAYDAGDALLIGIERAPMQFDCADISDKEQR
jgi:hypothetical protein